MRTILEELYNGNIYPDELIISKDSEYGPLNEKICNTMETWKNKLSEDDYKQLEALLDLNCRLSEMEASASFVYGFKLGAVIMIEALTGQREFVRS